MNNSECQTQEPVGGMKWVKASERLPGKTGYYFVKYTVNGAHILYVKGETNMGHVIEWLDENYTPPPAPVGIDVDAFQKAVNEAAEKQGKVNDSFKDISRINSFKEGVFFAQQYFNSHTASLPQSSTGGLPKLDQPILDEDDVKGIIESSTEEEKDLWIGIFKIVSKHILKMSKVNEVITELQPTYKISKR